MWLWLVVHRNCIIPFSNFCDVDIFPVIMQLSSNSFWCIEIKIKIDDTLFKGRVQKKRKKSSGIFHKGGRLHLKKWNLFVEGSWRGGGHQGVKKISLHFWMIQTMFKNKKKSMETDPKSVGTPPPLWKIPDYFFFFLNPSLREAFI